MKVFNSKPSIDILKRFILTFLFIGRGAGSRGESGGRGRGDSK